MKLPCIGMNRVHLYTYRATYAGLGAWAMPTSVISNIRIATLFICIAAVAVFIEISFRKCCRLCFSAHFRRALSYVPYPAAGRPRPRGRPGGGAGCQSQWAYPCGCCLFHLMMNTDRPQTREFAVGMRRAGWCFYYAHSPAAHVPARSCTANLHARSEVDFPARGLDVPSCA